MAIGQVGLLLGDIALGVGLDMLGQAQGHRILVGQARGGVGDGLSLAGPVGMDWSRAWVAG